MNNNIFKSGTYIVFTGGEGKYYNVDCVALVLADLNWIGAKRKYKKHLEKDCEHVGYIQFLINAGYIELVRWNEYYIPEEEYQLG
jgi:hypothetical protein